MLQGATVAQMGLPASRPNTTYSSFCASIQKQGTPFPYTCMQNTKTATLFYHAAAAGSYSMGWSSCRVCPSTHTSLRSNICVLTFSLALVASHACMHAGSYQSSFVEHC